LVSESPLLAPEMSHANPSKPFGAREVAEIGVECDVCPAVVRAVLRAEPLKSRARARVWRWLSANGKLHWIRGAA
jgi:hypothetical protein